MDTKPFRSLNTLYFGVKALARKEEILRNVKNQKIVPGIYLITFASNGIDQLDIVPLSTLHGKKAPERLPAIVGICQGREEAFETVGRIAADAYRKTGACHLREYLLSLDQEGSG